MIRPSLSVLSAAVIYAVTASPASLAASPDKTEFDCQRLVEASELEAPADWLERSLWAGHCYIFQARAVRISGDGVRTLALTHDIQDGVEREAASYLDGPAMVYERIGRGGAAAGADAVGTRRASPGMIMSRLGEHYRLSLEGEERIAGRRSMRLDIEPLDSVRYGHRLWLDSETALPLKQVLIDTNGQILETFQMTELAQPQLYDGVVAFSSAQDIPFDPWQSDWLPAGYESLPLPASQSVTRTPVSHRLYSDGLSSFSIFIEPVTQDDKALLPGIHRLGISHAAVRHLRLDERVMQVVVMGEMPPQVLRRIASQVEYRPESQAVSGASQ